jgi:tetratricopeptide (TPR) repeat protein
LTLKKKRGNMNSVAPTTFGELLKDFRKRRRLTQAQVAAQLGTHRNTVGTWEHGDFLPESKGIVLELARALRLDDQETRHLLEASLTALAPHWSVPLPRNPFFTGREEILEILHGHLRVDQAVAITQSSALHGLGGIGKTQIALEYAYRYALEYSAAFWIAAETEEQIIASLLHIAEMLQLSERDDKDQQRMIAAVQRWLSTYGQWLLIWDNVEDLTLLDRFLPSTRSGSILLTTRRQTLGTFARGLDLLPMEQEEGVLFLLRRAKVLSPEATSEQVCQLARQESAQYVAAAEIVTMLGGLPLALDQAGAYLETTRCGLPAYQELFHAQRAALLTLRGEGARDHPESVSTTLQLAITRATLHHPALFDLLRVCAFLQADAIPEELFRQGGEHLGAELAAVTGSELQWNQLMAFACSSSLLSRQPEQRTLSLHRLVQVILLESMTQTEREQWSRCALRALDAAAPEVLPHTEQASRKQCERLLPHILQGLHQAHTFEDAPTLASLAYKAALYLYDAGRYTEAQSLYQRALHIREQVFGPDHPKVADVLHCLAALFGDQGRYEEAKPLYQRTLSIREQALGPDHPRLASTLNNLAILCQDQRRYEEAEVLYQRALFIWEQALGSDHPQVAYPLNNLAELYRDQGRYEEAEVLYQRALSIWERALGPEHPQVAHPLAGIAILARDQGKYAQAEALFQQARFIREQHKGLHHPETAETLHDLALLRQKQGELTGARALAEHALHTRESALGEKHPKTMATRTLYVQLVQEQADGAEPTLEQIRTLLRARGWSMHLKKRRDKPYVYATRKVGKHTQSRYLAPLSDLAACLAATWTLPNAKE